MLSKPFRGMTRSRLLILLVLLLALEGAGGAGLYRNNHPAAAGSVTAASPTPATSAPLYVTAMPSLLIARKLASFASRLPDLANKTVTYQVKYSDGKTQTAQAVCDVSGYSSTSFTLRYAPVLRRETITVRVLSGKQVRISTVFSVLLPAKT